MTLEHEKSRVKRVMIVDDHPLTREGLAHLIEDEPDLVVSCQAGNAQQAKCMATGERLDLALIDIKLPDQGGIELVEAIKTACPELAILVVSMHEETLYAERALRAGARGYISKQEGGAKIMQAIRHVLEGRIYVSEKVSARLAEIFSGRHSKAGRNRLAGILSDREFQVFKLLGLGLATHEIAERLNISVKTVEAHRLSIKTKLKLTTSAELIAYAARSIVAAHENDFLT